MTTAGGQDPGPLVARPFERDDDLLMAVRADGRPRLRIYPWDEVAVVIGRGGKQSVEIHADAVARDGVPLYRRPGGGCSVVLDPGNVILAAALPLPGIGGIKSAFAGITGWLIAGLEDGCGLAGIQSRGVSDLALAERKVGGSCVYRTHGLLLYATTLLVRPDLDLVERYLRHPPREPQYRRGRPHRQFMGSLREADPHLEPAQLAGALAPALERTLPALLAGLMP